jgi:para-aminobenzoate synthetase
VVLKDPEYFGFIRRTRGGFSLFLTFGTEGLRDHDRCCGGLLGASMRTLVFDNYDSFTFNLCQLIGEVNGEEPLVVRNDELSYSELASLHFDNVVISPGPGRPDNDRDFGVCGEVLAKLQVPILGVCLGHQGLALVNGCRVVHAPEPVHGRLSTIHHNGSGLFAGIPDGFAAVRYHSLIVAEPLPPTLSKTAWTKDGLIMGLQHLKRPCWGVQFHPESICSEYGFQLLQNFRDLTARWNATSVTPARRQGEKRASASHSRTEDIPMQGPGARSGFEVRRRLLDRFFDPEQVFVAICGSEPIAFWLDSSRVEPGLSRFSAVGTGIGPSGVLVRYKAATGELTITDATGSVERRRQSIFYYLETELQRHKCEPGGIEFGLTCGGFVGYFGYELKWECGSGPCPEPMADAISALDSWSTQPAMPDAVFLLADRLIVFDHHQLTTQLICLVRREDGLEADAWLDETERRLRCLPPLPERAACSNDAAPIFRLSRDRETYLDQISRCQKYIAEGESYEICLTNRMCADASVKPLELYRILRHVNPAPYAALLVFPEGAVLSSSPERFLSVDRNRWVESKPIKGTRPRGATPEEDKALREDLRTNRKDRAENLMIVDLVRNDLGRVCQTGTVSVPRLMEVETYATVHQLVSTIRGRLAPSSTTIDCIRNTFPGGSMTGAPKRRTMSILEALEGEPRGVYSGAIGYLGLNGTADLSIVIRTIVLAGGVLSIGIGGAIVALSDPEEEFAETLLKGRVLVRAAQRLYNLKADSLWSRSSRI